MKSEVVGYEVVGAVGRDWEEGEKRERVSLERQVGQGELGLG